MMTPVGVNSALNELHKEVVRLQDKEISSSWKDILMRKFHDIKMDMRRIKVERSVIEPEVHPIRNSLILKTILDYVEPTSHFSTLKSLRGVSKEFNDLLTPKVINRSFLSPDISRYREDFYKMTPRIQEWDKMSLKVDYAKFAEDKKLQTWVKDHGHKVIGLSTTVQHWEAGGKVSFPSSVGEMFPNLQVLHIYDNDNNEDSISSISDQIVSASNTSKMKLKDLKIIISCGSKARNVISTTIDLLLRSENLESLTCAVELGLVGVRRVVWTSFFSATVSKSSDIFKNLRRLELLDFDPEGVEGAVLNRIELPNLRGLTMHLRRGSPFIPFLELVRETLEELKILFLAMERWIDREDSSVNYNLPQMPNLLVFEHYYAISENDYALQRSNNNPQGLHLPLLLNARNVTNSMPGLKEWRANHCSWDSSFPDSTWGHSYSQRDKGCNYFSDKGCELGMCNHIQQLLETEDELPCHENLEKLDFSCTFREPQLISRMASAFGNLKELSLWIQSPLLNEFFNEVTSLKRLKVLKIILLCDVEDFPNAVNSNLPDLKNLKELFFQNGSDRVPTIKLVKEDHSIFHIDEAHDGFAGCTSLEILTFRDFKIDVDEWKKFQEKLAESKPDLAVNKFSSR